MQLRHLRSFVKIVEAGSFSRAAATIRVAQPALSQQIAELEREIGVALLLRTPRGIRPTPAGEVFLREATAILRQVDQLPGIVRSTGTETEGVVAIGMSSTLAARFAGPILAAGRAALPKVTLRFATADSATLAARIEARTLDLALVFEDEPTVAVRREPLFRQRLYYVARDAAGAAITVAELARLPLILPAVSNVTRRLLDRTFAAQGLAPSIVAELDVFASALSLAGQGLGGTVLPLADASAEGMRTVPITEPPLHLTAALIASADTPLTRAGEAVRALVAAFVRAEVEPSAAAGVEAAQP